MRALDPQDQLYVDDDGRAAVRNHARLSELIHAYMAWPEDESKRNRYCASEAARKLRRLWPILNSVEQELIGLKLPTIDIDPKLKIRSIGDRLKNIMLDEVFLVHGGGFGPVSDAALDEPAVEADFRKALGIASLAGRRLLYTAIMQIHHRDELRGGASLSKATDLIVHKRKLAGEAQTEKPIRDAWRSHRQIAHLAATSILIERELSSSVPLPLTRSMRGLSPKELTLYRCCISNAFLEFGVEFRADRSEVTCLDPDLAYRFPVALPPVDLKDVLSPLDEEDLDFLVTQRWADPA